MSARRVVVAFGTRPEASKMAPVVHALAAQDGLEPVVAVTGQHRQQLDAMLDLFGLQPEADLKVMTERQGLAELTGRIIPAAAQMLRQLEADYVLVHGDTSTTFAVAFASFLEGIPVGHVEAGLRSHNLREPFPEEANRRLTDVLTDLELPPTSLARDNLLNEGKSAERMVITGNTVVDAVRSVAERARLPEALQGRRLVTVTMHRRENLPLMAQLAGVLAEVARENPELTFVYPLHLNPAVREAVMPALQQLDNFLLLEPLGYEEMVALLSASELAVSDSGGIQEEGAALGVPVAVLRNVTERPEGLASGSLTLLGNEPKTVRSRLRALLTDGQKLNAMRAAPNPYGDGEAGRRVAQAVAWRLGLAERPRDWQS